MPLYASLIPLRPLQLLAKVPWASEKMWKDISNLVGPELCTAISAGHLPWHSLESRHGLYMQETVPTQADTCSDSEHCLLCSPEMNPTVSEMNPTLAPYFPFRWPSPVCSQPPLPRLCTVQLPFVCLLSMVGTLVSSLIHLNSLVAVYNSLINKLPPQPPQPHTHIQRIIWETC